MESLKAFENWLWHQMIIQSTCGRYVSHGAVLKTLSKYAGFVCCCRDKCDCEHAFIKKVRTHISAKASTKLPAGDVASQRLHSLCRAQRSWQRKCRIYHPWYHERSRGVILKGCEIQGFLDCGMVWSLRSQARAWPHGKAFVYRRTGLGNAQVAINHHWFSPGEKCLTS